MADTSIGIITSSTSYQYAKEVFGDKASILKLGMIYPLPEKLIKDFAEKVDRVIVLEELDPIIENHCKQLGIKISGKIHSPIARGIFTESCKRMYGHGSSKRKKPGRYRSRNRPPVMCAGLSATFVEYVLHMRARNNCHGIWGISAAIRWGRLPPLERHGFCDHASECFTFRSIHGFNKALGAAGETDRRRR